MIVPKDIDIGRKVIYSSRRGENVIHFEEGVITSFNEFYVFARYGADTTSKGARREDLEWLRT